MTKWRWAKKPVSAGPELIVMVKNSIGLLPEFLLHHLPLFERIHVIDHNSKYDLRCLTSDKITVYRANIQTYFQEEFVNLIAETATAHRRPSWLFVLDVDEFLPFSSRSEFSSFLKAYKNCKVISFQWRNGLPADHLVMNDALGVIDSANLIFHRRLSNTQKCAINTRLLGGNFYIPRSNHRVQYRRHPIGLLLRRAITIPATITGVELYHIVSSSLEDFRLKIANFKKSRRSFDGVKGHGGSLIYKYPNEFSFEDWLVFTANYRSGQPNEIERVTISDFSAVSLFYGVKKEAVATLRKRICENGTAPVLNATIPEMAIIQMKRKYGTRKRVYSAFRICGNEILIKS